MVSFPTLLPSLAQISKTAQLNHEIYRFHQESERYGAEAKNLRDELSKRDEASFIFVSCGSYSLTSCLQRH
jgi:hypothetical protein